DRRFLALEFIDGANPGPRNTFLQLKDLRVVRSDDQNIVQSDWRLCAITIDPRRIRAKNLRNKLADFISLLRTRTLVALVNDGVKSEARAIDSAPRSYRLQFQPGPRAQAAFVK